MKYSEYVSIIPDVKDKRILRVLDEIQDRLNNLDYFEYTNISQQNKSKKAVGGLYTVKQYCTLPERQFLDELKEKSFLDELDGDLTIYEGKKATAVIFQDLFKTNFKDVFNGN